jgi:hypothetical protein
MSQRDNFGGGFFWGTLFGGVLGGILGATLASRYRPEQERLESDLSANGEGRENDGNGRRRSLRDQSSDDRIEAARRSLEGKIAQLNDAIDDVRQQLQETERGEGNNAVNQTFPPH